MLTDNEEGECEGRGEVRAAYFEGHFDGKAS
jgi:hypothetical protein